MLDSPDLIARKLSQNSPGAARGDIKTAQRLIAAGGLTEYDEVTFGPLFSSPRPKGPIKTPASGLTPAAVLIALLPGEDGYEVLLTRRTEDLPTHKGQISFPGGRVDATDTDVYDAALREAWEETALPRDAVSILGRLDPYVTVTAYEVTPVVGLVEQPVDLVAEPGEVGEIFTVPLAFLLDPANHRREGRTVDGVQRAYYAIPYQNKYIWGATAGMLINLYEVLTAP